MSISFDASRMERVREVYEKMWSGELNRPVIAITRKSKNITDLKTEILSQSNCNDFSVTPEEIILRQEKELESVEFLGDAFPVFNLDVFGPGTVAAFCGAKLDNSSGSVWFYPPDDCCDIEELHIEYNPDNIWARRIKDIIRAGVKRWKGSVIISYPDMGGIMDILASFRTSEQLLFDLYDYPDGVKRLLKEIIIAWNEAFDDITAAFGDEQGGYTDWNGVFSLTPTHIQQCDFSYMISKEFFDEFALDDIIKTGIRMGRCAYHLDGEGCLKNLDTLLKLESIRIMQWVPGAGNPHGLHWIEEYRRILNAGKCAQIVGDFKDFKEVAQALPANSRLFYSGRDTDVTIEEIWEYTGK